MNPPSAATAVDESASLAPALDRALYQKHLPLVRRVALRTAQSLPAGMGYDDVVRAGFRGLAVALASRTDTESDEFLTYAAYRVRLAVLEFLKAQDPNARKMRGVSERISASITEFVQRTGRVPEEIDVANDLGLDLATYQSLLEKIADAGWVRLELTPEGPPGASGNRSMSDGKQMTGRIESIIRALPDPYQIVLGLYYQEQCDLSEISEVLGITSSRACQMHAQAVHLIRGQLAVGAAS